MSLRKQLLMIVVTLVAGLAQAQTFAYMPERGRASPQLDIYGLESVRNAPVMIYVHGGAWMIGDKRRVNDKPTFFNQNGYIFISVNYTLVPRTTVEGQLEELDAALGYIAENIARMGGDPQNISLIGHSAGAHLVNMMVLRPLEHARTLLAQGGLRAVISNDTRAYDISRIAAQNGGRLPRAYAKPFGNDPARWQALSPQTHIRPHAAPYPAFFVAWSGQGNGTVRVRFGQEFAARLRAAGADVTLFDGGQYSHEQINRGIGTRAAISNALAAFLAAIQE